ncbi:MAG: pantoate--beta-alanine ligase [Pseudomonadota bacterium]
MVQAMERIHDSQRLRQALGALRGGHSAGDGAGDGRIGRIAFVPTMGALHAGHLCLVDLALRHSNHVVASLFVNPAQFAPGEDFALYPRTVDEDCAKLAAAGVRLVFLPTADHLYGPDFSTSVNIGRLGQLYCGKKRPDHFAGVCLVMTKLLNLVQPDYVVLGEKDFQQFFIVQKMVRELNIPVTILQARTIRNLQGLALSSRNQYLSKEQMIIAPRLYQRLHELAHTLGEGKSFAGASRRIKQQLLDDGFTMVEYLSLIDQRSFHPLAHASQSARLLCAAYLGTVRLIDTIAVADACRTKTRRMGR